MNENKINEKLSVLIVGNNDINSIIKKIIPQTEYRVVTAKSYNEALQKVKKNDFDLIMMDMDLPDGDWVKTILKIRDMAGDVNIVTMSNINNRDIEQSVREQRVMYYVVKPFEDNEIKSIMEHLSQKKQ